MTFVDIIGDIVANIRPYWDSINNPREMPYYLYGHPIEIFNTLSEKDQHDTFKFKKYPLIALFQDFEEDTNTIRTIVNDVTIVIMTETSPDYKADARYDNTFTPTLQPLYELFIKYLKRSTYLASDEDYQHTKIDRLYWGTQTEFGNDKLIGHDALDAIVITGLNLRIIKCK